MEDKTIYNVGDTIFGWSKSFKIGPCIISATRPGYNEPIFYAYKIEDVNKEGFNGCLDKQVHLNFTASGIRHLHPAKLLLLEIIK